MFDEPLFVENVLLLLAHSFADILYSITIAKSLQRFPVRFNPLYLHTSVCLIVEKPVYISMYEQT